MGLQKVQKNSQVSSRGRLWDGPIPHSRQPTPPPPRPTTTPSKSYNRKWPYPNTEY